VGTTITSTSALTGSNFTGAVAYTISPALPTGLSLNPSTGVISGTPTVSQVATTHTITGRGATAGTATSSVGITVVAASAPAPVPTLGEWAMIFLVSLMGMLAWGRKRKS
jgi:hypothetical protein